MKQKLLLMFVTVLLVFVGAACGKTNEGESTGDNSESEEVLPLEVSISTSPETGELEPGEEMTIQAKVTQGVRWWMMQQKHC
ncbi:hypothetical protein [Thalassobacillus pellis]|uniref:hypothetical protein n=1 Tax=Thalassobacillus pellis TaxID=748008 RepID=UPI001960BB7C|nr:hypothetical protein [Thalassobacillus pellis]MBM7554798.1 hypothetical protein [Thalassobacillus pellis]